ncbi:hypothetical protein H4V96_004117 [Janthinobacterium sp. CG_23.4]|nr:hypothetical protein [Janthinobacterium sp. CG_23.4]
MDAIHKIIALRAIAAGEEAALAPLFNSTVMTRLKR